LPKGAQLAAMDGKAAQYAAKHHDDAEDQIHFFSGPGSARGSRAANC
jgi:hypothetical protein